MISAHDNDCSCGCVFTFLLFFSVIYTSCHPSNAPQIQGDFQPIEYGIHTFNYSECVRPRLILEQDADVAFQIVNSTSNIRRELRGGGHSAGHSGHGHASGHSRAHIIAARTAHMRTTRNVVIRTATVYALLISGRSFNFDRRIYILDHAVLCPETDSANEFTLNVTSVSTIHRAYVLFALIPTRNETVA